MGAHRQTRIEELFHAVVDLTPSARAACLDRRGVDAELRQQLESLLAAHDHVTTIFGALDRTEAAPAPDPLERPIHSRYPIVRELGRGGMGVVYLAEDLQLDRPVALKFLSAKLAEDSVARSLLQAEARASARLDHPNVGTVFELGQTNEGRLFIAMAYYEGHTLRERLERGPLNREEAVGFARQIAQGLSAAHKQGLVHRDIKPGNLLVTTSSLLKIVDFGLAERADPERTRPAHAMGSVAYMSPEQARGEAVDDRTDLWSLGVVLYEMLTGRRPFTGDSPLALLYSILHDSPDPPGELECTPALQRILERALAKDPAARYQEAEELLADLHALGHETRARRVALPTYLTGFVGRGRDMAQGSAILRSARLVTMTGAPGTGKTRLASRLAAELEPEFRDGVVFVALAALTDPALVASAVAQGLGVRTNGARPILEDITAYLRDRHLLLVLDNFEQVLQAAEEVRRLVSACAQLTVLVTSRAALRLSGEREFPIPPLGLPDAAAHESVDVLASEAVALFVQRAVAADLGFGLSAQNATAVAEICRRLDGLPLAIELAAARVKVLPPRAMLARLERRLHLLKGGARDLPSRHQTLRQAIGWSYELLEPDEQMLLRRLSVFVGGHTLEAAEVTAGSTLSSGADVGDTGATDLVGQLTQALGVVPDRVLEGLASLVDKNLLRQETQSDGEPRFAMLETIREFALERLAAAGEEIEARRAQRDYYVELIDGASAHPAEPQQIDWLDQLAREHDNLLLAFEWSLGAGEPEPAERLAVGLWRFWLVRGHLTAGRDRLSRLLRLTPAHSLRRPRLLTAAGTLAHNQGDHAAARAYYQESLALSRVLGDEAAVAGTLNDLGWLAWRQGEYQTARALSEEALGLHRQLGDRQGTAHALNNLGWIAQHQGDYDLAASFHRDCLLLREQAGDTRGMGFSLTGLGRATLGQGALADAVSLLDRACDLLRQVGERQLLSFAVTIRALTRREEGDLRTALGELDASLRTFREIGDRYGAAFALNTAAIVWHDLGGYDRADAAAQEALALTLEIDDRWGNALAHATRARIARARQRHVESVDWWRTALTLWAELGDVANVAVCFEALADPISLADETAGRRLRSAATALRHPTGTTEIVLEPFVELALTAPVRPQQP